MPKAFPKTSFLVRLLVGLVLVAGAFGLARFLVVNPPTVEERDREERLAPLVEIFPLQPHAEPILVAALGEVVAAERLGLAPRVSGRVESISELLVPGAFVPQGMPLLKIDEQDFLFAERNAAAAVAAAESALASEQGQQAVAREELKLIEEPLTEAERRWVLREPQLASARAELDSARANLEAAQEALRRTEVAAPFDAVVLSRNVARGTELENRDPVAELARADEFWIELAVPSDQLRWIAFPDSPGESGAAVHLSSPTSWKRGQGRTGSLLGLVSELDRASRMATVLARVKDPMAKRPETGQQPQVLLGSILRGEIEGITLEGAYAIPRRFLRPGDQVWLAARDDTLAIEPVEVLYRGEDFIYVKGDLRPGDRLITRGLRLAVPGMKLRIEAPAGQVSAGGEGQDT
ncbi:MAG: efflux RND transporter periplasmic adaptor subunit [Verrucomicrobiota bacterium]